MSETIATCLYQPVDIVLPAGQVPGNPFDVELSARFLGPDGTALRVPGFYAGGGAFRIRFAPTCEGPWRYVTHSPLGAVDGVAGVVETGPNTNPTIHGPLGVDPEHPHHFRHHDGTRPFVMGYECDWLWALDQGRRDTPHLLQLLDLIAEHNFNAVNTQLYAHHCGWSEHVAAPARLAPPRIDPWAQTPLNPDFALLTPAYFDHYDHVMNELHRRGITVFLMIRVYNKFVHWPENRSPADDRYWRYVVARYQAYPNLVWVLSKEAHFEEDRPGYWQDRIRLIRSHDAYGHLVSTHDDDEFAHRYDLDLRFDQQHTDWNAHVIREREQRCWPVMNVEFGYEGGPIPTYPVQQPIEEVVRRAWLITVAGGYLAYYYSDTAWDVISFDEPAGYDCFSYLQACMRELPFWEMAPRNDLVDAGYCLAAPGLCYLVVLDEARTVTVDVEAERPLPARWLDPMTGRWCDAGEAEGGRATFNVPASVGKLAVLVIGETPT
jgi:hypothetical protein